MPVKVVHCKQCNASISGYDFPERMAKIRRHYARHHKKEWKEAVRRGARKRARAR